MKRRTFLQGAGTVMGAAAFPAGALAQTAKPTAAQARRIGMTTACFRHHLVPPIGAPVKDGPRFDLLGAPKFIKDTFGIGNIEVWSRTVPDIEIDYFQRLRTAARQAGARISNVQIDGDYDLNAEDPARRATSVAFVKSWMDKAKAAGAPTVRINIGGGPRGTPLRLEAAVESIRAVAAYGRSIGVKPLVENHGTVGAKIDNVVTVIKALNDPSVGAIVDWGITEATTLEDRIADISKLFPYIDIVSAKGMHFDKDNKHVEYPIEPLVRASEAAGFRGVYSVELYAEPDYPADTVAAAKGMVAAIASSLKSQA